MIDAGVQEVFACLQKGQSWKSVIEVPLPRSIIQQQQDERPCSTSWASTDDYGGLRNALRNALAKETEKGNLSRYGSRCASDVLVAATAAPAHRPVGCQNDQNGSRVSSSSTPPLDAEIEGIIAEEVKPSHIIAVDEIFGSGPLMSAVQLPSKPVSPCCAGEHCSDGVASCTHPLYLDWRCSKVSYSFDCFIV